MSVVEIIPVGADTSANDEDTNMENKSKLRNLNFELREDGKLYDRLSRQLHGTDYEEIARILRVVKDNVSVDDAKNIIDVLRHKEQFFIAARSLITSTVGAIEYKACSHIIVMRDEQGNRLISMCLHPKIRDAQYHIHITKSIRTTLLYLLNKKKWPENVAIALHKAALQYTGATRIYSSPFPYMLELLCREFHHREVPNRDYAKEGL